MAELEVKCVYCDNGLSFLMGTFVVDENIGYHELCLEASTVQQQFEDEKQFHKNIITAFVDWYDEVNHYGDFDRSTIPYDEIITKARKTK